MYGPKINYINYYLKKIYYKLLLSKQLASINTKRIIAIEAWRMVSEFTFDTDFYF